jgi:hypothetical protein
MEVQCAEGCCFRVHALQRGERGNCLPCGFCQKREVMGGDDREIGEGQERGVGHAALQALSVLGGDM